MQLIGPLMVERRLILHGLMKPPALTLLMAAVISAMCSVRNAPAASCDGRYAGVVFSSVTISADVDYGCAKGSDGQIDTLKLDVFEPNGDSADKRPLIVFIHGGGFSQGDKTDDDIVLLCDAFSRRGYVTASINYRLSRPVEMRLIPWAGRNLYRAIYRAVQDTRTAVRYLRAHGAEYRIDTSTIFAGGTSAGAVTALQLAYMDQSKSLTLIDTAGLGPLESTCESQNVSSRINGVINCWGAVGDSAWIAAGGIPVVSIHHRHDHTVPYDIGRVWGLWFLPKVYGSVVITRAAERSGIVNRLKTFAGSGHMMHPGDPQMDTSISIISDFLHHRLPDRLLKGGSDAAWLSAAAGLGPVLRAIKHPARVLR